MSKRIDRRGVSAIYLLLLVCGALLIGGASGAWTAGAPSPRPAAPLIAPPLYLGVESYRHWDKLSYIEVGDRVWGQTTADPAGTIISTRRGRSSTFIKPSGVSAPPMPASAACPAANARVFEASRSYPATGNPLLAILRARFAPITPRPTTPTLYIVAPICRFADLQIRGD